MADCKALVAIANSLGEDSTVGIDVNWIGEASLDEFLTIDTIDTWDGVSVDDVNDAADVTEMRVIEVDLSMQGLTGGLADAWADLDELTLLDLSDNSLEGTVPRSVWAFFDDKITDVANLNLDGNPMLEPSPALNLKAVVTKNSDAQVALSFDNIWYTTEVAAHEYRYSADGGTNWGPNDAEDSDGWMSMGTGCDTYCAKLDDAATPMRLRKMITSHPN